MTKLMYSLKFLFALLFLGLIASTPLVAQTSSPRHSDPAWQVSYWANDQLAGTPVLQGLDVDLDHNWGFGSPDALVPNDHFSGRWLRYIDITPGNYRFTVSSDDGVRVWLDGEILVDEWVDQPLRTYIVYKDVSAGHHEIKVEYYEKTEKAILQVGWERVGDGGSITEWRGEYFNNTSLSGQPVLMRNDQAIDFAWGSGSPKPGMVASDNFSVRWTRNLELAAGNYRFSVTVDDGVRLFVNGHLLIDAWKDQPAHTYSGTIYLPGGQTRVQMEYYERTELATAKLWWNTASPVTLADYRNALFGIRLKYPSTWSLVPGYGDITHEKYAGVDGYFILDGAGEPGTSIDVIVRNLVEHVLQPFGTNPTVEMLAIAGQPARLILPSAGQSSGMNGQTALIVSLPRPAQIGTHQVPYLILYMDMDHSRSIADSLVFETTPPPTSDSVIVDETDSGFLRGGTASGWGQASAGYNGHVYWTQNNQRALAGYNWGRWLPTLSPGRYEVYVYIPSTHASTRQARYWISHQGGFTLKVVNQSNYWDQWVSLGTYTFAGTSRDYVSLADVTYEPYLLRDVAWDAVKWVAR